jgi:ParB family chromosome partitioning protein
MDPQALDALAASIEASGLMQPIVVRPTGDVGSYELIAGERRWRAMTRLGRPEIPAIVREAGDHEAAELALIENLQREDLNPMDRATALRRLSDEFGLTHQQLAERVGLDRATVSNVLRLNELDAHVAGLVRAGTLSLGHAKCLLGVGDLSARRALADASTAGDWSVRQLEAKVREGAVVPRGTRAGGLPKGATSAHLTDLQRQLEQHLGTRVQVRVGRKKGAGELRIQFFSLDEFDGLMARIGFRGNNLIV